MSDERIETSPADRWEALHDLLERGDAVAIEELIAELPPGDAARTLSRLSEADQTTLLEKLGAERAATLLQEIPDAQGAAIVTRLEPDTAASIVHELPSDEQADLLGVCEEPEAEAILAAMEPEEARQARQLVGYPDDQVGSLMVLEYLSYASDLTVGDAIGDLREHADEYRDYVVQYSYVTDRRGKLVGVLRLRDLVMTPHGTPLERVMQPEPLSLTDTAGIDNVRDFFERTHYSGVPVVDADGVLVGLVRRADLEQALGERSDSDFLKTQGIPSGEELRTMGLVTRARRRLSWLSVNILLNVIAASVIAVYKDTLSAVIALAVFLPIISDMSGCSGNQAVAVSLRELALGLARPADLARVWIKEVSVGALNGFVLGLLIAGVAWLWKGNAWLGLVVGIAMMVNTVVAVSIGGTVPLLLKRLGKDPALASGPILTTITDMCGFFLILGMATALLPRLV